MYPVAANPDERTSRRGARNVANARYTETRYERKPVRPGMPLRTRTTAGPKPSPILFTNHSPSTCPTSKRRDRKSTRLNSSHLVISYAVFCLKKKKYILNSQHGSDSPIIQYLDT